MRARRLGYQFLGSGIALQAGFKQVVREGEHAAACVVDQDDLVGVEQVVRDDETADHIVSHHAPRIADDVRVARLEAEQVLYIETRIHAGHDR